MIVRLVVVDPAPPNKNESDLLVYQVAGHRHLELLLEVFAKCGIEAVTIETPPPTRKGK